MPRPGRAVIGILLVAIVVALAGYRLWRSSTRPEPTPVADVVAVRNSGKDMALVFVHGVLSDPDGAFTNGDVFWPKLLLVDPLFDDVDVYTYGYGSEWLQPGLTVKELANDMHLALTSHRLPERYKRIAFICHSMGGLVTRAYLVMHRDALKDKIAFLYFFGTPSSGSQIATIGEMFLPNTQLKDMSPSVGDDFLRGLQEMWLAAGYGRSFRVVLRL